MVCTLNRSAFEDRRSGCPCRLVHEEGELDPVRDPALLEHPREVLRDHHAAVAAAGSGAVVAAAFGYIFGAQVTPALGAERVICWMCLMALPVALPVAWATWPDQSIQPIRSVVSIGTFLDEDDIDQTVEVDPDAGYLPAEWR